MDRHFTVSIYIVHEGRVLLHQHKKANILLPVGGHIDNNELPQEAAIREVLEETGLQVELYDRDQEKYRKVSTEKERILIPPMHMICGKIEQGHEHIDFVFYGSSISENLQPGTGESTDLRWYWKQDLEDIREDLLEDIYLMAKEAIEVYA